MINRMIGDEQLPEDSERNPNGTLKSWPKWLAEGKPSPTGRFTFTSWRLWQKDSPLQESGLLGPVTIQRIARF
jgi:GH25 family lysozyme M1 (1,4-beta-N-acetylmuramidase)